MKSVKDVEWIMPLVAAGRYHNGMWTDARIFCYLLN
jgi:hypothetical protein